MMIDYVTLMLVNMTAGYFLLGCFVWRGPEAEDRINWAPIDFDSNVRGR